MVHASLFFCLPCSHVLALSVCLSLCVCAVIINKAHSGKHSIATVTFKSVGSAISIVDEIDDMVRSPPHSQYSVAIAS